MAQADAVPGRKAKSPKPRKQAATWDRELITPEGVDLRLRLASGGERAAAFVLDILLLLVALILFTVSSCAVGQSSPPMVSAIWLLGAFFLRNFYFIGFELRPGAATPGKRACGLRVAARNGGRLTADMVIARNAMRELEFFLPMSFLFQAGAITGEVDGWLYLLALVWSGIFVLFPFFNRDRLRVGDFIAGTWVVKAPRLKLLPDLAGEAPIRAIGFDFTQAQAGAYGVKELHVLEDVLRRRDRKTMAAVATRIRTKIEWQPLADETDAAFLEAYYAALRGRLESRLLFGHRRKDKFDTA